MNKGLDFVGVTIVYFCHDGKGNFVMAKRSKNCRDEIGKWDVGAGALEVADSVEETLRKEIMEEYCTEVVSFEFLGYRDVLGHAGNNFAHWLALDFKVLVKPELVKIGEPHKFDDIKWFNLENLLPNEELHSQLPYFLNKYKGKL